MLLCGSPKMIIYVKYYVKTTRRGLPIYHNFPVLTAHLPSGWPDLCRLMKRARIIAERIIYQRLGRRVKGNLEFFIQKASPHKPGFVVIFPKIVVDPFGNVVEVNAPREEHREAYRLYIDYLRDMYVKTGDKKWWYKYLGVSTDPDWPLSRFKYKRHMKEGQIKPQRFVTIFDPPEAVLGKPFWLERVLKGAKTPPSLRRWLDYVLNEPVRLEKSELINEKRKSKRLHAQT